MANNFERYTVFIRTWWRKDERGRLVPNSGGRKHILERGLTLEEAQRACREWNAAHDPGNLSRKAEFMSD